MSSHEQPMSNEDALSASVDEVFELTPEAIESFRQEVGASHQESLRRGIASALAVESVDRRYPDARTIEPDTFIAFCNVTAVHEYLLLKEFLEKGTVFQGEVPTDSYVISRWLAAKERYLDIAKEITNG